jgi:CheY-like chemotaxis protein
MNTLTFDDFVGQVRSALHHLYDPDELRRSPLASLFGVAGDFGAAAALERILTDAVEALKPPPDEPPQSRGWRIYDALVYRYVRRFEQDVVADQLGISGRQLRREQRAALEVLAEYLWKEHGLEGAMTGEARPREPAALVGEAPAPVSEIPRWLADLPPEQPGELAAVLRSTLDLARPLAQQAAARLELAGELSPVVVSQTALRYALLNTLGVAIPRAQGCTVSVSARLDPDAVEVRIEAAGGQATGVDLTESEQASIDAARHLMIAAGGSCMVILRPRSFAVRLALPALEQVRVLVVDDNADTLQLLGRYVAGTRYALTTTRDPRQVLRLVDETEPDVIVLDVMMPEVDGWELLSQLRQQAATVKTPIIVCTVLPQQPLALALGASMFLQKPISRETFLAALDAQSSLRIGE